MAQITGQAGSNLTDELAKYLSTNQGNLTSEQLTGIINQYLTGGDKLGAQGGALSNGIYKRFGEFDLITGKVELVTTGIWTGDTGSLSAFYTSSAQTATTYYTNVYSTDPSGSTTAVVQFATAYGHRYGSGSISLANDSDSTLSTKATYAQYRSILLDQDDSSFTFVSSSTAGTHDSEDIYVINVNRARYKEQMDPGNFALTLSGSKGNFTFIDDSGKKFSNSVGKAGRVFNIVSGSLNLGTEAAATTSSAFAANGEGYGLFYPDLAMLVLNPSAIGETVGAVSASDQTGIGDLSGSISIAAEQYNQRRLFHSIRLGASFVSRRTENISTAHYFVRATNREFNFSNNPTFVSGSDGTFANSAFETNPQTYITTIGLYSDSNELLAVAKTSQPIVKSFDREVLVRIKLDF
jgi:hypothetical protein